MLIEESKHRPTNPSLSWGHIMYVYLINVFGSFPPANDRDCEYLKQGT